MALNLGELVAIADVDDRPMDRKLDEMPGKFSGMAGKLKAAGLAAGIAAAVALGAGFVDALDLEAGQDKLAAQLGISETESARLGAVAGDVYSAAFGDSMGEVNDAVAAVYTTFKGQTDEALEDTTAKGLAFADTFGTEVARGVDVAGRLVASGLARDSAAAFDLLTAASQQVPAAVRQDLLDATDEYSQFFAAVGLSGEEAMAALVRASADGMYGIDKTGDAIKELGIRATDMSTASVAAYEAAGLNAEDMAARFVAGGDTAKGALDDLITGLLGIEDPVERSNAAIALFGTPLEDLSVTEIPDFLTGLRNLGGGLGDVEGAAGRMTETLAGNASTRIETFKRGLQTTFVEILGGKVIPFLEDAYDWLDRYVGPAVEDVTGFLRDHQDILVAVAAGIGAAATAYGVYKGVLTAVSAATKAWTAVQWLLNVALNANPIGLIITAIGLLVGAFVYAWQNSETFRDVVKGAIEAVQTAWQWAYDNVFKPVGDLLGMVFSGVKDAVLNMALVAVRGVRMLLDFFLGAVEWIVSGAAKAFGWVPGLGPKLEAAAKAVEGFRDDANASLAGIERTIEIMANGDQAREQIAALRAELAANPLTAELRISGVHGMGGVLEGLDIPGHAEGARVTGAHLAVVGEGRESEWVLPDSKLAAFADRIVAGVAGVADRAPAPAGSPTLVVRLSERLSRAVDTSSASGQFTRDGLGLGDVPVVVGA